MRHDSNTDSGQQNGQQDGKQNSQRSDSGSAHSTPAASTQIVRTVVRFTGRVQGVGFRATASATASGFPVTGWVRNLADGSVHLEAQGAPGDVKRFILAVSERLARYIKGIDQSTGELIKGEASFIVQR